MNCTVCGKDVNEHGESRETNRCVAEKLKKTAKPRKNRSWCGQTMPNSGFEQIPLYSSPDSIDPAWELTDKFGWFYLVKTAEGDWHFTQGIFTEQESTTFSAPTPQLAIIRAYLVKREV